MPQTAVIGAHRGGGSGGGWVAAENNCNYQKWLVSWKQSRVSFCVWVHWGGRPLAETLWWRQFCDSFLTHYGALFSAARTAPIQLCHGQMNLRVGFFFPPSPFFFTDESRSKEGSAELPAHLQHHHPRLDSDNAATRKGCHIVNMRLLDSRCPFEALWYRPEFTI